MLSEALTLFGRARLRFSQKVIESLSQAVGVHAI